MLRFVFLGLAGFGSLAAAAAEPASAPAANSTAAPSFAAELVFPLHPQHNHAPGIVECPNGDLLVSWYRGSGERSADDVAVLGARKRAGQDRWTESFPLVDTPGFPDCNTTLFIDAEQRLWLFWPVVLANSWESCLTQYRVSSDYQSAGPIRWSWQGSLFLKPKDFESTMTREFARWQKQIAGLALPEKVTAEFVRQKLGDKLGSRLGWQPRNKPTVLRSGRILLPLYSDTFSAGLVAISDDRGATWRASTPLAGFGSIQPTIFEKRDGNLVAYMRENGVFDKIRVCESTDGGETWGTVTNSSLPNPGAGVDGVRLRDDRWCLVYNDQTNGRNSLAVSLSEDEGRTWKWTRHLESAPAGSFHYPAVIQGRDDTIHVVYSYFVREGKSMKHAAFNAPWLEQGDPPGEKRARSP